MVICRIYLHNYDAAYYPGSDIRGRLLCSFRENTNVLEIKVSLVCQEYTGRTEPDGFIRVNDLRLPRFVPISKGQEVFCLLKILYLSTTYYSEISSGHHEYPFHFTVPDDAPSSYSCQRACVTYQIQATVVSRICEQDIAENVKTKDQFTFWVVSPIDFSRIAPELQEPRTYSVEEQHGLFACKGDSISLDVKVPKTVFVPGENIPITVHVANMSNFSVDNLKVKLVRCLYLRRVGDETPDKFSKDVASVVEHGLGAHSEHTYDVVVTIPEGFLVYNFTGCRLISAEYGLKVYCDMPFYVPDVEVWVPNIKIGHVPVSQPMPERSPSYSQSRSDTVMDRNPSTSYTTPNNEISFLPSAPPPSYGLVEFSSTSPLETPPPSYNEAMRNSMPPNLPP